MTEVCSCCKTISGRRSRPRPPILSLSWKRAKALHILWSEPRRPPKLLQTKTALFSFGGLRGLWSRCVGCFWMQLFMAVPMTPSAAVADFGGRRNRRFIPFNFLLSLAAPHLHGVLVLVTGNKFIAGVVVTGDNSSPVPLSPATKLSPVSLSPATKLLQVSLSPVIICSPVSTTPAITENPWQRLIAGVVNTAEQFITGDVDTGDKLNSRISPRIFEKIPNGSNGILGGLGDTDSWKKPEVENLVSDSL